MFTPAQIAQAELVVSAMSSLEACPGWPWMLADIQAKRDGLKTRVSDDADFPAGESRGKVRYGYLVLRQLLLEMESTYQAALHVLQETGTLPSELFARLRTTPEAPAPESEMLNPFAQATLTLRQLFGATTPP